MLLASLTFWSSVLAGSPSCSGVDGPTLAPSSLSTSDMLSSLCCSRALRPGVSVAEIPPRHSRQTQRLTTPTRSTLDLTEGGDETLHNAGVSSATSAHRHSSILRSLTIAFTRSEVNA
jgi:hypothetical protein